MTTPVEEEIEFSATTSPIGGDNERIPTTSSRRFPDPFYDTANSNLLLSDPVVDASGDSYEKSTLPVDAVKSYYPNRALARIIEEEKELSSPSWQGSLRLFEKKVSSKWAQLVEKSAFATEPHRPLPESFYCPILCEIMTDPVVTKEGVTYERVAIEAWIKANGKSPMTRNILTLHDIRPNNAIYDLIQLQKDHRNLESIHPSIRRWQESGAETTRPSTVTAPAATPATDDPDVPVVLPAIPGTVHLPTTEADIEARRLRRLRNRNRQYSIICFTFVVMFLFFPYFLGLTIFIWAPLLCCYCCYQCRTSDSDD
jgi:hypothetical protein